MIKFFIKNFQATFLLAILIIIIGVMAYSSLPRESAPEIRRPLIFVTTTYHGVSAKDLETLVTKEIENELEGVEDALKINSSTSEGISSITVEFDSSTDVETALRRVRERVDVAKAEIPKDVDEPVVRELNFADAPIMILVISHPNGLEILETYVDWLEEEIKRVSGVLDVKISGKLERELAIEIDPIKLKYYDLSLNNVIDAIRAEHVTIPAGILKNKNHQYNLSVSGEIKDPHKFNSIVVSKDDKRIRLDTLATVKFHYKDPTTLSRINGEPGISLSITKRSGENLLRIVDDIKELLEKEKLRKPPLTTVHLSHDESKHIRNMVQDLENNILSGLLLVLLITFVFLGGINAVFVSIAIPFSMLLSFFILQLMGITLNMVVLFSLVLALGMLVDNGIVIVENIYRHKFMNKTTLQAAIDGAGEVAIPITTSTLTTILAFFPIVFMPDIMGEFMSYIPKTVIIVLASSLIVGLTLNTTFCSRFLRVNKKRMKQFTSGSGMYLRLQHYYTKILSVSLNHPLKILIVVFIIVIAGLVVNAILGKEPLFFPRFDPEVAIVEIKTPAGTSLNLTDDITKKVEHLIKSVPTSIKNIQSTSGRAASKGNIGGGGADSSNDANIRIGFKSFLERKIKGKASVERLKNEVLKIPGALITVREMKDGPPAGHPISYEIVGDDYETLGNISDKIGAFLKTFNEFEIVDSNYESSKPEIRIDIDRLKAQGFGLSTHLVASTIRNAINGSKISKFRQGKEEYDLNVRYQDNFRDQLFWLNNLEIVKDEKRIPLSAIANISNQSAVSVIKRKNLRRTVEIWADFLPDVQNKVDIKKTISTFIHSLDVPHGYSIHIGEGESVRSDATAFLKQAFIIALLLIFIVLVLQFNSFSQPIIILIAVFLSIGGVFWGIFLSGQTFVIIMSGIGIISLAGVVVNNGIILIDFINTNKSECDDIKTAIIEAGNARLRPVLLTAITTVIGLFPMALGISFDFHTFSMQWVSESSQWWSSMAWTIIYGLSFATVLTLVVVPILVYLDHRLFSKKI